MSNNEQEANDFSLLTTNSLAHSNNSLLLNLPHLTTPTNGKFTVNSWRSNEGYKLEVTPAPQSNSELSTMLLMFSSSLESVQSNNNYIFSMNEDEVPNETSSSFVRGSMQIWEIKALKQALLMQLSNHHLKPVVYKDESDGANFVEFHKHKSHFVYVADDEGVQLLWTKDEKRFSEFIPDDRISILKVLNNVAQLLPTPD